MAVRDIVLYRENEAALREKGKLVKRIIRRVRRLVQDLKDTLNDDPGEIELAAPQIDVHSRVIPLFFSAEVFAASRAAGLLALAPHEKPC